MKRIIFLVCAMFLTNFIISEEINKNVKNFSQLPDVYDVKISPNGKMVGVLREIDQERMVSIIDLESKKLIHNHRFIRKGQIGNFEWLSDERLLFARRAKFSGENRLFPSGELYATNIDGKKSIMLTGPQAKKSSDTTKDDPRQRAIMVNKLEDDPDHILIQFFTSDRFNKLYKLNTNNGEMERFATPPVRSPFYAIDESGRLAAVSGLNPKTFNIEIYIYNKNLPTEYFSNSPCTKFGIDCVEVVEKRNQKTTNKNWTFWKSTNWEKNEYLSLVSYNSKSTTLFTIENTDSDLSGIYKTNLSTGEKKLIYRHSRVDIDDALIDDEGNVYAAKIMDGYPSLAYFKGDSKKKELSKLVRSKFPGNQISISAVSDDETKASVFVQADINSGFHVIYDLSKDEITPLGKYYKYIDDANLAFVEPISFKSRDGTIIYGYLTKSRKGDSSNSPTIVHPHGGPEGVRDRWGFDHRVQMFASEGFNVLQVNFRGSGGYGRSYGTYIRGNWDGVLNDIFDGIEYASDERLIDINRICIYGGSYGGYAATQGAIMRPDLFKCSVSDVGVYHIPNLFKNGDIQASRGGQKQLEIRLGTDEKRHIEMSPHFNAEKLTVPFFMLHGENDIRAPYEDAVKFSKKLNSLGIKHKSLFIEKEGHGYFDEDVRYESNMELIRFFKEHLN
ncbi:MAG: prolyl oligopeptidase family serine peptidase [SAR86 cluster bacterium]|nr:prolyl oligopeptidase family serine peptidase [SAR86 cluster bacterium]